VRIFHAPCLLGLSFLAAFAAAFGQDPGKRGSAPPAPIVFVTQVPIPGDFTTIGSTFGNQLGSMQAVGRGGDLWILYPDGNRKNLTEVAGFGNAGLQGASAIAVRDPAVHWDGQKVLFSMVIGAPVQFEWNAYFWQLYEVSGLGPEDTPSITKVPNQPQNYNNIQGTYGSDDRIIFVSDRPHNGAAHLYPLLDEYEEAASPTGLWSLDPVSGDLFQLNHTPSGAFTPRVDSEGRVIFTRWDHLQRDQQADADETSPGGSIYGTFDFADESAGAARLDQRVEVFPEPRAARTDQLEGTNLEGHSFNRFFPWQINQDGTDEEMVVHIGRHELVGYFNRSFNDDANLVEFIAEVSNRTNPNEIENFFQPREDPLTPGRIIGIDAPEFQTHAAGQVIALTAPVGTNADDVVVEWLTHRDTATPTPEGQTPSPDHSGLYRDPLALSDGTLVAVHTAETHPDQNEGTRANPLSRYDFRLKALVLQGDHLTAGNALTAAINKNISYFDPDVLVSYNGPLWQMSPVEVRVQTRPPRPVGHLPPIETDVFGQVGVDIAAMRAYLMEHQLALVVSRNTTTRDAGDRQQPFNLRVAGTGTQTLGAGGRIYDIAHLQFFQADHLRGVGGIDDPEPGRRVLARPMHDPAAVNPPNPGGPAGSVAIGADGSMAAFIPARRAMTWQLTEPNGTPVVRERFWLTFQPGEIRVCASCHGINTTDQADHAVPQNPPQALFDLLTWWQSQNCAPGDVDINGNGSLEIRDAVLLINGLGTPGTAGLDFNCDGAVDIADLHQVLADW